MKKAVNWKVFLLLVSLSLVSVICVFPYVITLQHEALSKLDISIWFLFFAQFIQSAILFSILIFLGLFFIKRTQFQMPLINAIVEKKNYSKLLKSILGISILAGILTAVSIYALDALFSMQGVGISTHQTYAPIWQKLLAAFYGGITEEIITRLFLMSLFIWIGMKLRKQNNPSTITIIVSIFLAAIIFGLGHLPITASLIEITPLIVLRAVVLNGIGGVIFGWLFWKKGLESAMIAHFIADIFLLTLLPLLVK